MYVIVSQELTLVTKPGEGFGISLSGGVNGYHGNPLDETDEGIFISQVQITCTHKVASPNECDVMAGPSMARYIISLYRSYLVELLREMADSKRELEYCRYNILSMAYSSLHAMETLCQEHCG